MIIVELFYNMKKRINKTYHDYFTVDGTYTSLLPDRIYLKKLYKKRFGKGLNLKHPVTYTEKLNWLKLYDRRPEYTTMVDKYAARDFVKKKIEQEGHKCSDLGLNFVPLLGVWDKVDDVDFESLPDQFVLKCNHDNGVIICKDKSNLDIEATKKELAFHLNRDYYKKCHEWPYKNVKRKIIAEKFMENTNGDELVDYKLFCFNGVPKFVMLNSNRFREDGVKTDIYDMCWNHMEMQDGHYPYVGDVFLKPAELDNMVLISKILSEGIPFVRVDFNIWNRKIYMGELTFYHSAGFEKFRPEKWDDVLGGWINLPLR